MTSGVVIVTGGRHYADRGHIYQVLGIQHRLEPITLLVHGACPVNDRNNADFIAEDWARANEVSFLGIPAKFSQGRWAGPERNENMLLWQGAEGRLIAFPGGRGTNGCVEIAERLNEDSDYGIRIIDERGEAAA